MRPAEAIFWPLMLTTEYSSQASIQNKMVVRKQNVFLRQFVE